jgi:hypothetical protein
MFKIAAKYGLIGGLIMILPNVITFIVGVEKMSNPWLSGSIQLVVFVLLIFLGIKAVRDFRHLSEGTITFTNAFATAITAFLITAVISIIFTFIMQNYIDPEFGDNLKQATLSRMEKQFESSRLPEEQKEAILQKIEEKDFNFNITMAVKALGINILIYSVISLIIAASVKKDMNLAPPQV